jgi:hypothetical protein
VRQIDCGNSTECRTTFFIRVEAQLDRTSRLKQAVQRRLPAVVLDEIPIGTTVAADALQMLPTAVQNEYWIRISDVEAGNLIGELAIDLGNEKNVFQCLPRASVDGPKFENRGSCDNVLRHSAIPTGRRSRS